MNKTKEYEKFKKLELNRDLNENNVKSIIRSIETQNLLEFRPILVDEQMRVIDGKHRLEAAKRLGIDVYYEVIKKAPSDTVLLLNANQKKWTLGDYLNYFCNVGKSDYVKIRDIMNDQGLSYRITMALLGKDNTSSKQTFKLGNFSIKPEAIKNLEMTLSDFHEIKDFLKSKKIGSTAFLDNEKFKVAMIRFLTKKGVQKAVFIKKLELRLELIRPCVNVDAFLDIFVSIYNWKNTSPIDGKFDEAASEEMLVGAKK